MPNTLPRFIEPDYTRILDESPFTIGEMEKLKITYPDENDLTYVKISGQMVDKISGERSNSIIVFDVEFPSTPVASIRSVICRCYMTGDEAQELDYANLYIGSVVSENPLVVDNLFANIREKDEIIDENEGIYVFGEIYKYIDVTYDDPDNGLVGTVRFDLTDLRVVDEITEDEENEEESGGINPATHEVVISKAPLADFMRDSNNHSTIAHEWAEHAVGVGIRPSVLYTGNVANIINKISMKLNGIEIVDPDTNAQDEPAVRLSLLVDPSNEFLDLSYVDSTHIEISGSFNSEYPGLLLVGSPDLDPEEYYVDCIAYSGDQEDDPIYFDKQNALYYDPELGTSIYSIQTLYFDSINVQTKKIAKTVFIFKENDVEFYRVTIDLSNVEIVASPVIGEIEIPDKT